MKVKNFVVVAICLLLALTTSGCAGLSGVIMGSGPAPGTVGFYDVDPVTGKVVTENVNARRMHRLEDNVFVYRVDNDKVVIGHRSSGSDPNPFAEIAGGVVLTIDATNKLAAYLGRVIAQFDSTEKTSSVYMDYQFRVDETVKIAETELPVNIEVITVRFQYVYNKAEEETEEIMLAFLGGGSGQGPTELTYDDIKVLLDNLKK